MIDDMPRKLPLHVTRQRTRHGRVVFYFRRGKGQRTRLPNIDDPAFEEAYKAALAGNAKPERHVEDPRSLLWLITRYMESGEWAAFSAATRKQRGVIYQQIIKTAGPKPFAAINEMTIQQGLDRRAATPAQAIVFLKAMRKLFAWAKRQGHMKENPAESVEKPKYRTTGFPAWTIEDVIKFRSRHPEGSTARLAMELALLTGLRRSDLVRIGRQHMRGPILSIDVFKTGARVTLELPPALLDLIERTPTGDLHFIVSLLGKPFTVESFGNWFRDRCREAGVEKSAHGLRKLSATIAAEGGAGAVALMAQYGWTNIQEAERYTRSADRARLGIANSRLVAERIMDSLSLTSNSGEGSRTKKQTKTK
ncbi:MAG: tyrosine-type recombinase/integrase [Rhizobiaceae bacterium]|nr:tyrosine-type recombinase/integrase [Rhizobiaceae bacterium]